MAAWAAVRVLAGSAARPIGGLPAGTTLVSIGLESSEAVDDILVGTGEGLCLINAKASLSLSTRATSDLAKAIDQFVAQQLEKPLDPSKDCLILATSRGSSSAVTRHLASVVRRAADQGARAKASSLCTTAQERRAYDVVRDLVTASWRKRTKSRPTNDNLHRLLALIRIQEFDLEEGGPELENALALLQTCVSEGQAAAAWSTLLDEMLRLGTERSTVDRDALYGVLRRAGIRLIAAPDYARDVSELQRRSRDTLRTLAAFARLDVRGVGTASEAVTLDREVVAAICDAADRGSLLVVGEPGAGKSGALYLAADRLSARGHPTLVLRADRPIAAALAQGTPSSGLTHELCDILRHWNGDRPGVLLIDALDAARGGGAAAALQDLAERVLATAPGWRVVATIRKFDLRHGEAWRRLFHGAPPIPEFQDSEFSKVLHVNVPLLSDQEQEQAVSRVRDLAELMAAAKPQVRELLKSPFNLQLAAAMIASGESPQRAAEIDSREGLLHRYWESRVGSGGPEERLMRERVLRRALEAMADAGTLVISRMTLVALADDMRGLSALLSNGLLAEAGEDGASPTDMVTFAHHVLFDYAAARILLSLGQDVREVARWLSRGDRVLLLAPAAGLALASTWARVSPDGTRTRFWNLAFQLANPGEAAVGPLVHALVGHTIVERATAQADLAPLTNGLLHHDAAERQASTLLFRHVTQAIVSDALPPEQLVGPEAGPWPWLADAAARGTLVEILYPLRALVAKLLEVPGEPTPDQTLWLSRAACAALDVALRTPNPDPFVVRPMIEAVARTASADPSASAASLRMLLDPSRFAERAHEDLFALSRGVQSLIVHTPDLMAEIYRAALLAEAPSADEVTSLGPSRILALTSNRRQDYRLAVDLLVKAFRDFVAAAPRQATDILLAVSEHRARQRGFSREIAVVDLGGFMASIDEDYRRHRPRPDEPQSLAEMWLMALEARLAANDADHDATSAFDSALRRARPATLWSAIFRVAARNPRALGTKVLPLLLDGRILARSTLQPALAELIAALHPHLGEDTRRRLEEALLALPEASGGAALVAGIDPERAILPQMRAAVGVARAAPPASQGDAGEDFGWRTPLEDDWWLREQGIDLESVPAVAVREAIRALDGLSAPDEPQAARLIYWEAHWPAIERLYALLRIPHSEVADLLRGWGWERLTTTIRRALNDSWHESGAANATFLSAARDMLLEAARLPPPALPDDVEEAFARSRSRSGAADPREDAAEGLLFLLRSQRAPDKGIAAALVGLAEDPSPGVRHGVFAHINSICVADPDLLWRLVERAAEREQNYAVLHGLVCSMSCCLGVNPSRAAAVLQTIVERCRTEEEHACDLRRDAARCVGRLWANLNVASAGATLRGWLSDPVHYEPEVSALLQDFRYAVRAGDTAQPAERDERIRRCAAEVYAAATEVASRRFEALTSTGHEMSPAEQDLAKAALKVLDMAATELYFGSGAYHSRSGRENEEAPPPPSAAAKRRFLSEFSPTLVRLARVPWPSVTHHLLETLEFFVPDDPVTVFRLMADAVLSGGGRGGYQLESMGIDLFVRLTRRYLAEYRWIFSEHPDLRAKLVDALHLFAGHGWPAAYRLVLELPFALR